MDDNKQLDNFRILAQNALEAGESEEALNYYNKIIELEPADDGAWLGKCKSMSGLATLANMREGAALSAAKNAVNFAPDDTKKMVSAEAAQALTEFCRICFAASRSHTIQYATVDGALAEDKQRMMDILPCADYAVELASRDTTTLELAIKIACKAKDREKEGKYVALMKEVNPSYSACFPGSSRVLTPSGYREIRSLKVGERVLSVGKRGLIARQVTRCFRHAPEAVIEVRFAETIFVLRATANHRIATADGAWSQIRELRSGDRVHTTHGCCSISTLHTIAASEPVHNIFTAGEHNFIVDGIVVHNFVSLRVLRTWLHRVFVDPFFSGSKEGYCDQTLVEYSYT